MAKFEFKVTVTPYTGNFSQLYISLKVFWTSAQFYHSLVRIQKRFASLTELGLGLGSGLGLGLGLG